MKKPNGSRQARLNLVTKVHAILLARHRNEDAVVAHMAEKSRSAPDQVQSWLPTQKGLRKAPGDKPYYELTKLYESLVVPRAKAKGLPHTDSQGNQSEAANGKGKRRGKTRLNRRVNGDIGHHHGPWRVVAGELKRRQGRPPAEDALFKCVAEKLPFSALREVKNDLNSHEDIGREGVYVAHDSMGVARYIGRGNIFNRLGELHRRHASELLYFSFYVVHEKNHEREIESILIHTAGPQLHFNERKKRVDIQPGNVTDFEAGTLFYERKARPGPKRRKNNRKQSS